MLTDEQLAGIVVFPIAFIGVLSNWTVALLIQRLPSLKNSFGSLTASQSIGDAVHSTVFAFLVAPMFTLNIKFLETNSSVIGHIFLVAYDISIYSHLCISLNRFCSIVAPLNYDTIFSQNNTKNLIIFSWFMAIVPSFYFYVYSDCRLNYIDEIFTFQFLNTPICGAITFYGGYVKYNVIIILIVIIDIITVSMVRRYKAKFSKSSTSQSSVKKHNAEMSFLKQACLQAFIFTLELFGAFQVMPRIDPAKEWLRFSLSTLAWVSVHTLDGIITIAFNKEFTKIIFEGIRIRDLSSVVTRNEKESNELPQTRLNISVSNGSQVFNQVRSGNTTVVIIV